MHFKKHWLSWFLAFDIVLAALLFVLYSPENRSIRRRWISDVFFEADRIKKETTGQPRKRSARIDAPFILQKPELPRGCEVTSLAMLLQKAGIRVGKMELAREIKHVPYYQNRQFGNPNEGFVGSMEDAKKRGYGVYHEPLAQLGRRYLPSRIIDLSDKSFDAVFAQLNDGIPVVVITNVTFKPLAKNYFHYWRTSSGGTVKVTNQEHAVLITGYDQNKIIVNDPLRGKNTITDRASFIKAWEQMGGQAISYRRSTLF
ncbi:C39 family peptidase [Sporolactobacillus shoreicorticis]|uniref:C39 family peptidase n=1 Tax=Sporolactobacillus shoreicorticis TaxID=1923877 RepID=A0ABW5RYE1_9BACL|nr:C39 family peptidase [Sporolactobacillus shoreicorticis]MCO7124989.1 C39 family peptidase [Sporolactobacillus shoreicorticis]